MQPSISNSRSRAGFALVVTLSLMVLLSIIAVGLLTLSTISLRSSSRSSGEARARANAKLAMMIAIGRLQNELGPDQRVSASGAILSDSTVNHPHWTGVWESWKAGASGTSGTDTASEESTIAGSRNSGMSPSYQANRKDHFRSWLVSLDTKDQAAVASAKSLILKGSVFPDKTSNAVKLVGSGSLGTTSDPEDHVSAQLITVRSVSDKPVGRYGWWVGDESQKARVLHDSYDNGAAPTLAEKIFRQQAPGSTGTKTIQGLETITNDQQLGILPSIQTLDLVTGATARAAENFHNISPFSYGILADVREGGLKRDLTTLLERPVDIRETSDSFMLYRFDSDGQERVPIQDLAAFYQLYNGYRTDWKEGTKYSSSPQNNLLPSGIQVSSPDFGNNQTTDKLLRNYTTLYRRPVPVKVQFLLSTAAEAITPPPSPRSGLDTHRLILGITPSVTLWNPTNLPIIMNFGDPYYDAEMLRLSNLPFFIQWNKNNGQYISQPVNLTWAAQSGSTNGSGGGKSNIFSLYFSGKNSIKFQPGEVKVFSLPYRSGVFSFSKTDDFNPNHEVISGWDPSAYLLMRNSAPGADSANISNNRLTFKASDSISFTVRPETASGIEAISKGNELPGSGLQFFMIQTSHQNRSATGGLWHFRDYQLLSRYGSGTSTVDFNASLITKGFPARTSVITSEARSGSSIIAASGSNAALPFLQFALMAGSETSEASNGGSFSGRKFASRPFLHSTSIAPPFIDKDDGDSLYNYGWNWWVQDINSIFEANVQVNKENEGYYGGGYTPESGTTHLVQQELPVVPPMSIAALSSAHLGGFSIATDAPTGNGDGTDGSGYNGLVSPFKVESFQRVTATGYAGLLPHTLQAIGNSYAHPQIPPGLTFTTWSRLFSVDAGPKTKTFVDHSYLANKALWDEFFFSSISPQPSALKVFNRSRDLDAKGVAQQFFFDKSPLPDHRMVPYMGNLDQTKLNTLFSTSNATSFIGGLADQIAAHLMVEGPFNINSTSIPAWKSFLSSLKGKPVAYLDKDKAMTSGVALDQTTPTGTPIGPSSLPNGKTFTGSTSSPSDPEQWIGWRELTDKEIDELATAVVKQVKLRGPFLSLSEFVNRRLDSSNPDFSTMGALQAAIDDEKVSINSGFRSAARKFSSAEIASMTPAFPQALKGPIAYGSSAYIDQADILRNFASQLTPRGDTFVIRTYGDSLDASGNVEARVWCESVVQRVPDYIDSSDQPQLKQSDLKSTTNKTFGRKFQIISFRWLNSKEV